MLGAGLIQHSLSQKTCPLVAIPKKDGSVRITVYIDRNNSLTNLDGQPLPRMNGVLDSLFKLKVLSLSDHKISPTKAPSTPPLFR